MKTIPLFLVSLFISFCCRAQAVHWDGSRDSVNIGKSVYVLNEQGTPLTIEQVSAPAASRRFVRSSQSILNFGFSGSMYWLKFSLDNTATDPLLLEVAQAQLPRIDLFFKDSTGRWQTYRAGYEINLNKKLIKHHFQLFPLQRHSTDYYLRFQDIGAAIPISIWKEKAYEGKKIEQTITYGIYIGIMIFVLLNNLFLFFSLGRFTYLHYTFLVLLYAQFSALLDGYIFYLFPDIDLLYWFTLNPIINQPNGLLYCVFFLEIRKYTPKLYPVAIGVTVYFLSYIVWYRFLPLMTVLPLTQVHALLGIMLMAFLGIRVGRKGNKLGYYFATAYFIFFIIGAIEVIYIRTGSPSYFFEISHVSVGIFIEVFILSYALSKRFRWEKADTERAKTEAQQLLLEKTQENERIVLAQNLILEEKVAERTLQLQQSIDHLTSTQTQLIQREKMASLGELTAGIAHEMQNPLNFITNFSEIGLELIGEIKDEIRASRPTDALAIADDLTTNLSIIHQHGGRAAGIVRNMLDHSRATTGSKELTDLNALADQFLRLAYHNLRAKNKTLDPSLITQFDPTLGKRLVVPQELGRVLMNLYNNAFYAVEQKAGQHDSTYRPTVRVTTRTNQAYAEIRVFDNGTGIPESAMQKVLQPFFTTKPAGQGTGLGLSLAYDIIVKGHGGDLRIQTKEGEFTEIILQLPTNP